MMLPPPCFTVGMQLCVQGDVFCYTYHVAYWPKSLVLISSDRSSFLCAVSPASFVTNRTSSRFILLAFFCPDVWSVQLNSCAVDRFCHLSCSSSSYHGSLGCFFDYFSPCPACQFRWTSMSW
ncbi:hypothetical protein CHARACLAT_026251 [Characodon lateralis]|uniref:Secreted protein n=1 Tax=Characodon lateralis TaxID=208331 RepID=A0ABU7ED81_9TELE|nr:hypothetical protein [Characodon lateralis]